MKGGIVIEMLGSHDRSGFFSGSEALDRYFRQQASQDAKRLAASCFVAVAAATASIVGYYTLAATSVPANDLPPEILNRLPRYPVLPAALVGRLAVARHFHRKGLGSVLLADAAHRVLRGDMKAVAVVVEAKDADAAAFYALQGFRPFASKPIAMYLPLGTLTKASGQD